jgi:hypothetical protein
MKICKLQVIHVHCDRPESLNNPLPDNGSLTHVSVTTTEKHLVGNGSVNTA